MPRLFFIAVLLVGVGGWTSKYYFKDFPVATMAIAGSESFYVVVEKNINDREGAHKTRTLIRIEPDGSFRRVREIDASYFTFDQLATDTSFVISIGDDTTQHLFFIASGALRSVPHHYPYKRGQMWSNVECEDILKKEPLFKDVKINWVYPLYVRDCYIVEADVPGTGGCTSKLDQPDGSAYGSQTFTMSVPETQLLIADMRKKTTTKVGGAFLGFSSSRKSVLVRSFDAHGNMYSDVVKLEDVLK